MTNYLDEAGAEAIANRLREYWRSQGRTIKVWVEKQSDRQHGPHFVIRSDLVPRLDIKKGTQNEIHK
jgi:hypothetical protein